MLLAGKPVVDNVERLITDMKESLEREMGGLGREMRGLRGRDDTSRRSGRKNGPPGVLLQTGSRWSSRMNAWAERIDRSLELKDRESAELRTRLDKLERDRKNGAA